MCVVGEKKITVVLNSIKIESHHHIIGLGVIGIVRQAEEVQQQWQQKSRFQTDGFFVLGLLGGLLCRAFPVSAILLRRNEQRKSRPPRSVDPLACDNRQFSRMELRSRLPV